MAFHFRTCSESSESSESSVEFQGPGFYESAFTDHYEPLQDIGEGGFAKVILARHRLTGSEVAVKIVAKVGWNVLFLSEPTMMAGLDHPNVIQLLQVIETTRRTYIIMEHAGGGHLRSLIQEPDGMPEEDVRPLFLQILGAVQYCHQKGIAHLDLKPENFMLDGRGNIKLIDFGLSSRFSDGQKLKRFWGTLLYFAPEVARREEYEGPLVDIWSLGVVLYFMLSGRRPFMAGTAQEVRKLIMEGTFDIPAHVSEGAQSLIKEILTVDPLQRPTLEQIMGHPWLSQGQDPSPCPPSEPVPRGPDPTIMTMMFDMGYDPYKAWLSLVNRQFDEAMGTYLILQHQRSQRVAGRELWAKPVRRVVGPRPGPTVDPARGRPNKCTSEPALPLPCEQQRPEEAKASGQKGAAHASDPALPLSFLHVKTSPSSLAPQQDPGPQWHVYIRSNPPSRVAEGGGSASQGTSTGQSYERSRGWRRAVTRRIATCLQQLCCCLPCFHGPAFQRRVAPMGRGHRPL